MEKIILNSIFLILSSAIFAGDEFSCSKMDNKKLLDFGARYGAFYALGYNDARKNEIDKKRSELFREQQFEYNSILKKNNKLNIKINNIKNDIKNDIKSNNEKYKSILTVLNEYEKQQNDAMILSEENNLESFI